MLFLVSNSPRAVCGGSERFFVFTFFLQFSAFSTSRITWDGPARHGGRSRPTVGGTSCQFQSVKRSNVLVGVASSVRLAP